MKKRSILFVTYLLLTACLLASCTHSGSVTATTAATAEKPWDAKEPSTPTSIYLNSGMDLSLIGTTDCTVGWHTDDQMGEVLKVQATGRQNYLTLNYQALMNSLGLAPVSAQQYTYATVTFKTAIGEGASFFGSRITMAYATDAAGSGQIAEGADTKLSKDETGWQTVIVDLSETKPCGRLQDLLFSASYNGGSQDYYYVSAIHLFKSFNEAIVASYMGEEMKGLQEKLTESVIEGVNMEKQTAPNEDATVDLWFDHVSARKPQADTLSSGMHSYLLRMPGNSIEGCQFFLSPESDRSFELSLSSFADGKGNTLRTELFYQRYFLVDGVMIPDALPPLKDSLSVVGNTSQGFYIKAWAETDQPAGLYSAQLQVKDAADGRVIKTATVYAYVWDFSLSEKTAMKTAVNLWFTNISSSYTSLGMTELDDAALYKEYYDFLLENRICGQSLPYPLTDERAWEYVTDPRVNSFALGDVSDEAYNRLLQDPESFQKGYFYPIDEPHTMDMLLRMQEIGQQYADRYPNYRMIAPFFSNIKVDNDTDQIAFMQDYLSIWNTKVHAFTPREYENILGVEYLMTEQQVAKYGSFEDRMEKEVAEGDELWVYFCWEPREPYANWLMTGNGTEPIVSVWQCRNTKCTGILYWCASWWTENMMSSPDGKTPVWGDGVLLYSGAEYGMYEPISSLRLENVRDGIEDYQMLSMVEELAGAAEADRITSLASVNVLAYTTDGDHLHAARILLGERVEELMK